MTHEWIQQEDHLEKTFEFKNFLQTMSFINAVAWLANQHNHHPQMIIDFNKAVLRLTTHDAGNVITDKDHQLAKAIDQLLN